ncbi:MAG TPA: hypothetical protein VIK89_11155 [Cytophagaceae bacterium]
MNRKLYILALIVSTSFSSLITFAQDDKIKFGAYSRAIQETNRLGKEDTTHADQTSSGHVLVDLGININPDKNTEIQAIMRLKSELGGFFGAGTSAELRQLYIKGLIAKVVGYQVGDIYLKLSPFTLYNNYSEGSVNEAKIFSDLRNDYAYYENLNRGNYWWRQGAHGDFTLAMDNPIKAIRFDAFFVKNRGVVGTNPASFQAGGRVLFNPAGKFNLGINYINLFDVGATINSGESSRNPVVSVEPNLLIDKGNYKLRFFGEAAYAQQNFIDTGIVKTFPVEDYADLALNAGAGIELNKGLTFKAGYRYVGPEFVSSGAQSKRVNFFNTPHIFPLYGNRTFSQIQRTPTIYDLVRDPSIYNPYITTTWMAYDIRLSNALPYGTATPNRAGIWLDAGYKDSLEIIKANIHTELLGNVTGEGTKEKKKYSIVEGTVDFNVAKLIGFKKRLAVNGGYRLENTKRGGDSLVKVGLTSHLIDGGIEAEVFKNLDLLLGAKMLFSEGNEVLIGLDQFNRPIPGDIQRFNYNSNFSMLAMGLKYRFSKRTYITAQYHTFEYKEKVVDAGYSLNQFLIFFNMSF